jgi:hypothetical protein
MLKPLFLLFLMAVSASAWEAAYAADAGPVQNCPGADDEPAMKVKTAAGPVLVLCGFEDHELKSPKGKQTFSEFTVYAWMPGAKDAQKVFASTEPSDTYWAKASGGKGLELEELWFFDEKPNPAITRSVTCTAQGCQASQPKCVLRLKKNHHPKALADLQKKLQAPGEQAEDLLDQVWEQALAGDAAAQKFYESKPDGLDKSLVEEFTGDQQRLVQAKTLKCPSLHAK